jgi:hypothetical protein
MHRAIIRVLAGASALTVVAVAGSAASNDGPSPTIHALLQEDEAVIVTLSLANGGEPGMGDPISLRRESDDVEVDLFEDQAFGGGDVVYSEPVCYGGVVNPEWCVDNPDYCADCDGDDVLECVTYDEELGADGWCETFNHVEFTDDCVPAGMATYTVWEPFGTISEIEYDSRSIDVEDVGQECDSGGDADADSDADADGDADADADGDSAVGDGGDGSCSVVGAGARTPGLPWLLLALLT